MVSQPLLEELKNIIKDECGRDLEMQDVARIAEDMVGYFDLLAKINYRRRQSHALFLSGDRTTNRHRWVGLISQGARDNPL